MPNCTSAARICFWGSGAEKAHIQHGLAADELLTRRACMDKPWTEFVTTPAQSCEAAKLWQPAPADKLTLPPTDVRLRTAEAQRDQLTGSRVRNNPVQTSRHYMPRHRMPRHRMPRHPALQLSEHLTGEHHAALAPHDLRWKATRSS